jgi:hypothetical protein
MTLIDVVVVTCSCGKVPLDKAVYRSPQAAWQAATDHKGLNPNTCKPSMLPSRVPVALAPKE